MSAPLKTNISRISISLPELLLRQLDRMVCERGFESRSQAVAEMIHRQIAAHSRDCGDQIMAGTITLVYDHSVPGLQMHLASIQHEHVAEVISSLHVHLIDAHIMEVILVQGPVKKLQSITDRLVTCRGVLTGELQMTTAIIPPLHPLPTRE